MRIVCPLCKRVLPNAPDDHPPRPFCSPRCKLADLDNWLTGTYRISSPVDSSDPAFHADDGDGDAGEGGRLS